MLHVRRMFNLNPDRRNDRPGWAIGSPEVGLYGPPYPTRAQAECALDRLSEKFGAEIAPTESEAPAFSSWE